MQQYVTDHKTGYEKNVVNVCYDGNAGRMPWCGDCIEHYKCRHKLACYQCWHCGRALCGGCHDSGSGWCVNCNWKPIRDRVPDNK